MTDASVLLKNTKRIHILYNVMSYLDGLPIGSPSFLLYKLRGMRITCSHQYNCEKKWITLS